tara:strand:+ start:92 stop:256 length:165 start_codon:yes stop_codon:yes gene_type:complete
MDKSEIVKNLKYYSKKIKEEPRNQIIFHLWLRALIKEVQYEQRHKEFMKAYPEG